MVLVTYCTSGFLLAVGGQSNKVPPGQKQHPRNGEAEHFDDQEEKWTSVDSWPYSVQRSNLKSTVCLHFYTPLKSRDFG